MLEKGVFNIVYSVTDKFYKLVWSNTLWLLSTGLPLFLFMLERWILFPLIFILLNPPGTLALFHVMLKWNKKKDISVWKEYWYGWKVNWKRSYIIVNTFLFVGIILLIDLFYVFDSDNFYIKVFAGIILLLATILYLLITITIFPLAVRFNWGLSKLIKKAFILSVGHLFTSLAVILTITGTLIIGFIKALPLTLLLFASLTVWLFTWYTERIISSL